MLLVLTIRFWLGHIFVQFWFHVQAIVVRRWGLGLNTRSVWTQLICYVSGTSFHHHRCLQWEKTCHWIFVKCARHRRRVHWDTGTEGGGRDNQSVIIPVQSRGWNKRLGKHSLDLANTQCKVEQTQYLLTTSLYLVCCHVVDSQGLLRMYTPFYLGALLD